MSLEVFISHSHKDADIARALTSFLVMGAGLDMSDIRCTSHSAANLAPGQLISKELRKAIEECRLFLPILTEHSLGSQYVILEIGAAWGLKSEIIPVLYTRSKPLEIPAVISGLLHCDLFDRSSLISLAELTAERVFTKSDRPTASEINAALETLHSAIGNP